MLPYRMLMNPPGIPVMVKVTSVFYDHRYFYLFGNDIDSYTYEAVFDAINEIGIGESRDTVEFLSQLNPGQVILINNALFKETSEV